MRQQQVDSSITRLNLSKIIVDKGIQPRTQLNETVLAEYSEAMQMGAKFPPITVFYDGSKYWLADGFHRVWAKKLIGGRKILAKIKLGSRRDAILYSAGANAIHGLQRTNTDKVGLCERFFCDGENEPLSLLNKAANHHRRRRGRNHVDKLQETYLETT